MTDENLTEGFGKAIKHQTDALRELTNDDIAKAYVAQRLDTYPSMVMLSALLMVMAERKFTVELTASYKIIEQE